MSLLDKASLVMIPSGYKEDVVYSAIPINGSGDLTFSRASNATRVNSSGLVEVCPWNLLQYSEDLTNAYWSKDPGVTIDSNVATAPNGTTTADRANYSGTAISFYRIETFSGANTFSVYLKGEGANIGKQLELEINNSGGTINVTLTGDWVRYETNANNANAVAIKRRTSGQATSVLVWGIQVNQGALKPYFPTTDRLNVPRLTYQNGGGGCPSLLLEKQSTNEVQYSQELDNAYWLKYQCSITANQGISPDGTQNADLFTTSGSDSVVYRTGITSRVLSYFAKAVNLSSGSKFYISVDGVGNAKWNQDGTLSSVTGGTATDGQNMGNGWFRFTFAVTSTNVINYGLSGNTSTSTALIWGLQNEAGTYPTSYISTTSATATRVADACFKTGISSLIGQTEGTMFLEVNLTHSNGSGGNQYFMQLYQGSTARIILFRTSSNELNYYFLQGGTAFFSTTTITTNGRHKLAFAYKSGDSAFYIDGVQIATNSTSFSAFSSLSELQIGANFNPTQAEIGDYNYNEVIVFPTRLTNAELQSLTTL